MSLYKLDSQILYNIKNNLLFKLSNASLQNLEIILVYDDNNKSDLRVIKKKFGKYKNFKFS